MDNIPVAVDTRLSMECPFVGELIVKACLEACLKLGVRRDFVEKPYYRDRHDFVMVGRQCPSQSYVGRIEDYSHKDCYIIVGEDESPLVNLKSSYTKVGVSSTTWKTPVAGRLAPANNDVIEAIKEFSAEFFAALYKATEEYQRELIEKFTVKR